MKEVGTTVSAKLYHLLHPLHGYPGYVHHLPTWGRSQLQKHISYGRRCRHVLHVLHPSGCLLQVVVWICTCSHKQPEVGTFAFTNTHTDITLIEHTLFTHSKYCMSKIKKRCVVGCEYIYILKTWHSARLNIINKLFIFLINSSTIYRMVVV